MHTKRRKQLTARFLYRTVLFSTAFSFCLVLFFAFGNIQEFMDSTQLLLLEIVSGTSLISGILSLLLIILTLLLYFIYKKKASIPMLEINFICLIVNITITLLAHIIILISAMG